MFDKNIFCTRLKEQRTKMGLTQSEIGKLFNVRKQAVSRWEKGENEPNIAILYSLADYFDVSLDYLVGRCDDPTRH